MRYLKKKLLMRIAIVAPPFISVPPKKYGGTELFIAELASGLARKGVDLTLYTNGASTLPVPIKWLYEEDDWPIVGEAEASLKALNHSAWSVEDAMREGVDVIHLNNAPGLSLARFTDVPFVYTVHHAYEATLGRYYTHFPEVTFATISDFQKNKLKVPRVKTVHHGIDLTNYRFQKKKEPYLCFLGRLAPQKGTHLAIQIAKESGIPLKIGGEIQPLYRPYWEQQIKPHVDGKFIEYVGEVGLEEKNVLLGNSMALLFPIQWDEPFGLVMVESMACGTPVLAMPGGSVQEIVKEGYGGRVRNTAEELVVCAKNIDITPATVRAYVEEFFSADRMVEGYIELYSEIVRSNAIPPATISQVA
jgi:glycosyltransferase involved in cell wall biosynthesis